MFSLWPLIAGAIVSTLLPGSIAGPLDTQVGPLEFYWPVQRPWYALYQHEGPCGTNTTVSTRTDFPLDTGKISLYIADDVVGLIGRVAYMNDPVSQSNFTSTLFQIAGIRPGQMCYPITKTLTVPAGTNATIQLEYTSWYDGSKVAQTFYVCADVIFQEDSDVAATFSCLNNTGTETSLNSGVSSVASESGNRSHDLSIGGKVGIAIGSTIGGSAAIALLLFLALLRRRHTGKKYWKTVIIPLPEQRDDTFSLHRVKPRP